MLDFLRIIEKEASPKKGRIEVEPEFRVVKTKDLMVRGGKFYAIWDEESKKWLTDEIAVVDLVDKEIKNYISEHNLWDVAIPKYMECSNSGSMDKWIKFVEKHMPDNWYNPLDETLIFSNSEPRKEDYSSKSLSYPLEQGPTDNWDKLLDVLYTPSERHKIEWSIGSVVTGGSKTLQKFVVFYGAPGTGKSTVLNVIQDLFDGYWSTFDAKALGSSSASFALEAFKSNPLVSIQHDGDLSKIDDNARLNSVISHETMQVNEKFKSAYDKSFKTFLFVGTNKAVKITDAKSGLLRRLIDINPSGKTLPYKEYQQIKKGLKFELSGIAWKCKEIFLEDPEAYNNYVPKGMLDETNDFFNFVLDNIRVFRKNDGVDIDVAWTMYRTYVEDSRVPYPFTKRVFKQELKNYFWEYEPIVELPNGSVSKGYYRKFKYEIFAPSAAPVEESANDISTWLYFDSIPSLLDKEFAECQAQYANADGKPQRAWDKVTTKLSDLDTSKLHYVRPPDQAHIFIDFDIPDAEGNKCFEKNLKAASEWPRTYAELSKSGAGIHLHYLYSGDPTQLESLYSDHVEIKVMTGKQSLRRMLTKCNDIPIATITSAGLPLKGEKQVINKEVVMTEKTLRESLVTTIKKCISKEVHAATKPNIDFINKILNDAYESGVPYDVSDMYDLVLNFAMSSTNQSDYCIKLVNQMHFKSDNIPIPESDEEAPIVFYDVEIFPNLFLLNWKFEGPNNRVMRMINPSADDVRALTKYNLVGFNNREYDNHILHARMLGYDNLDLYDLSKRLISKDKEVRKNAQFQSAKSYSYTDVYDYAAKKQSLKKWEIELGIHHQELGLDWDEPVPKEKWEQVAEYCDNDVIATEAVFNHTKGDFAARLIQVAIIKQMYGINSVCVNDTTNELSGKIIFGTDRSPQHNFNWRDLSKPVGWEEYDTYRQKFGEDYEFHIFDDKGLPTYEKYKESDMLPPGWSILPFFPGYRFHFGKSYYFYDVEGLKKAEEENLDPPKYIEKYALREDIDYVIVGEGGRVDATPGIHVNVWDGDITSQHPHSAGAEVVFGPKYTKIFMDLVRARVAIKRKDFELAGTYLGGSLKPYLNPEQAKDLAQALKIVINSIYGLTSAKFPNLFRDPNNIDNIVAKRGALFMTMLKQEVIKRGGVVAHIKTDSIKIPNATQEIKDFVYKFGLEYGYKFETEDEFEKFCLVNDAVYVAKRVKPEINKAGEEEWWTATGTQFQVPYVFKTLFSKKPVIFDDMCETKSVKEGAIYLDMNENLPDVTYYDKVMATREKEKEKPDKLTKPDKAILDQWKGYSDEEIQKKIDEGHNYIFVGRTGQFTPIKPGKGGGELLARSRIDDGFKNRSIAGSKGFRWLESELVRMEGLEDAIDTSYYDILVQKAMETISEYGDAELFVSDEPYIVEGFPWFTAEDPDDVPWYTDDEMFNKR